MIDDQDRCEWVNVSSSTAAHAPGTYDIRISLVGGVHWLKRKLQVVESIFVPNVYETYFIFEEITHI